MAIIGLTLNAEEAFQSALDPDKGTEEATTFKLGTIDSRVMGKLRDDATSFAVNPTAPEEEVDVSVGQNQLYYLVCQFGIKLWTKLHDENGNEIPFRTQKRNMGGKSYTIVADDGLCRVPQEVIAEIGQKLLNANEVTREEAKN